ncbi:hypothetical protein LV89_01149 [Arcicella aurantiaca]|uniref:Uncharacterized protein n=1 Tax=Arcicella aurantiaca TaxID=591202 RepID=A0A316EE83_9BACT|nr:hypothetical protein [Arcicella aurantiaca]PWK28365.1 hypothetical protein LV89_01149 [Arcicella aurantiaca]
MHKPDFILDLEKQASSSIEQLREQKFVKNMPFMLGELDLSDNHFYYEYANGDIAIAEFELQTQNHKVLRFLTIEEADNLREKFNLLPCPIYT